jgi:hypothetical protein
MDSQLQQFIEVQAEQNQLLKNQLRWLKFGLLALLISASGSIGCLGLLLHAHSTPNSNLTVVVAEPILEHPISLAENDTVQMQLPTIGRLEIPPMPSAQVALDFSFPVAAGPRPGRGCDGMCL